MNEELLKKMHPLVNGPEWELFMKLISDKIQDCQQNLENCAPESLRKIQGRMSVYREIADLRKTINGMIGK